MLEAVFYARFHGERGRSIIHQHPPASIVTSRSPPTQSNQGPLVDFSDISAYIIPPYDLCDCPLSICSNGYRILGFPISSQDASYVRNRFTFNVCFVLKEDQDVRQWTPVVRKTAMFFKRLQEDDRILQDEEGLAGMKWAGEDGYPARGVGVVYKALENVFEDLNAYREACVRVSEAHVLNLRLASPRPMPPKVQAWDVPLLIRSMPTPEQWTWDLALQKIHAHIDGVKHVRRIADVADVELRLVKRTVRELLYHDRAMLLDIFHFQAIYAQTSDFAWFVGDEEMQDECRQYVAIDPGKNIVGGGGAVQASDAKSDISTPTRAQLIMLYSSLTPGQPLQDFILAHQAQLSNIDVRRFVTFGIIKAFLHRIHKYALAGDYSFSSQQKYSGSSSNSSPAKSRTSAKATDEEAKREVDRAWKRAALSSGWATPPHDEPAAASSHGSTKMGDEGRSQADEVLREYLDGQCCMDQICVEMRLGERKIIERLRSGRFGEVVLFNR